MRAAHAADAWAECGGADNWPFIHQNKDVQLGHVACCRAWHAYARLSWPAWAGKPGALRGHTFHYSRLELPPEPQAHTVNQRGGGRLADRVIGSVSRRFAGQFSCPTFRPPQQADDAD